MSQKAMSVLIASLIMVFACAGFAANSTGADSAAPTSTTGNCLASLGVTGLPQVSAELAQLEKDKDANPQLKDALIRVKDQLSFPVIHRIRAASRIADQETGNPLTYTKCDLTSPTVATVQIKEGTKVSVEIIRQSLDGKVHIIQNIVDRDPAVADAAFRQMRAHNGPIFEKYQKAIKANNAVLANQLKSQLYKLNAQPVATSFKDATVQVDTSKDKDAQTLGNELLNKLDSAPTQSAPAQTLMSVDSGAQNS